MREFARIAMAIIMLAIIFGVAGFFVLQGLRSMLAKRRPIDYYPARPHGHGCGGCDDCLHGMYLWLNQEATAPCPINDSCRSCLERLARDAGFSILEDFDLLI